MKRQKSLQNTKHLGCSNKQSRSPQDIKRINSGQLQSLFSNDGVAAQAVQTNEGSQHASHKIGKDIGKNELNPY